MSSTAIEEALAELDKCNPHENSRATNKRLRTATRLLEAYLAADVGDEEPDPLIVEEAREDWFWNKGSGLNPDVWMDE
jgi:hypothetical protein